MSFELDRDRLIQDWNYRTLILAGCSMTINLLYACANVGPAYYTWSDWFIIMACYYVFLGISRFILVRHSTVAASRRRPGAVMNSCGVIIIILAIILAFSADFNIVHNSTRVLPTISMIAMAAYTFYKATIAIINIVRARRSHNYLLVCIRNLGLSDAIASMLSLERIMVISVEESTARVARIFNIFTGLGAFLLVLAIGIGTLVEQHKLGGAYE